MTNFKAVSEFNELIGNAKGSATVEQIFKQFDLITSEMEELLNGIKMLKSANRMIVESTDVEALKFASCQQSSAIMEIRDGIADVLVTTYGLAHRMGIDADKDMKAVSASNFSKFYVGTEDDAVDVCKALADSLGLVVELRERGEASQPPVNPPKFVWAFISADDSDPERPRGKLLKAPGYKPPVFE